VLRPPADGKAPGEQQGLAHQKDHVIHVHDVIPTAYMCRTCV
jgi:hypothetical protein